jgi:hypothetical protein
MYDKDVLAIGPWDPARVHVTFSDTMQRHNKSFLSYIENRWLTFCDSHPEAFNGKLLRLNNWNNSNNELSLHCGTTYYSHYIGTRDPDFKVHHAKEERADPLGLIVIPITKDKNVVISKRAYGMEQNPGKLFFFGGYAEPSGLHGNISIDLEKESLRETNEELGTDSVIYFRFIGLAYDPEYCHPEIFSVAILDVTRDELSTRWQKARDRNETESISFLPLAHFCNQNSIPNDNNASWSYRIGLKLFNDTVICKIRKIFDSTI